ncbi:MAG: CHASE domain-containing protein [Candidatus Kapabacteria bacterium]|nr:CHASE domain-containing protein [Candidatus Kapabacteria bacterium]
MKNQIKKSYDLILNQISHKKKGVFSIRKTYPAYIILVVLLITSFFVRMLTENSVKTNLINDFNNSSTSVMNKMSAHYYKQIEVLNAMNGLYDVLIEVVSDYFELYAAIPTKTYKSILSVSYIPKVPDNDLDDFILKAMGLGYFDFKLKTEGKNDFYYPFLNIVPLEKNTHRLGLDLGRDEIAMKAIKRARDKNVMTASEAYNIRKPDTFGLYIFYPIYNSQSDRSNLEQRKKNFQAVLSLEIDIRQFVKEALTVEAIDRDKLELSDSTIIFEIIGLNDKKEEYNVYKTDNYKLLSEFKPMLTNESNLRLADNDFIVRFYSIPGYGGKFQELLPTIVLIISIILSIAFFGFVITQITNKARAQEIAVEITKTQRRIVDSSNDIIAILDNSMIWKTMNPASIAIFGVEADEMPGRSFSDFLEEPKIIETIIQSRNESADDHTERMDLRMKKANGESVWVNWSFTFSKHDDVTYCIGRDVSYEKAVEENVRIRSKQIETAEIFSHEANFTKSYFMKEMSHQLRNSLTGIIGYTALLQQKLYDNQEEFDDYVELAAESSEELFTYIIDIDEAARLNEADTSGFVISNVNVGNTLAECIEDLKSDDTVKFRNMEINISNNNPIATIPVYENYLIQVLKDSLMILSAGAESMSYEINIEDNPYDGVVEIQILSSGNKVVFDLFEIYKNNSLNIIEVLEKDVEDVLIKITRVASNMRMLRGGFKVDSFGPEDGNLISIMFKGTKKNI